MAGDVAAVAGIALTAFLAGALFALMLVVAVAIRTEDRRTLRRRDRQLTLRERAPDYMASGVRQVVGLGQRVPREPRSTGPHNER